MGDHLNNLDQRVLVLAPTGADARLTCKLLEQSKVSCADCKDMAELVEKASEGAGALLVAEESLTPQTTSLLADFLSKQPSWSEIPICVITSELDSYTEKPRRLAFFASLGSFTILERPFHPSTLVHMLMAAIRARRRQYQVRDLLEERIEASRNLESIVEQRTKALTESNQQLEAFCYTIAHDLRAPLRAQQGFATALLDEFGEVIGDAGRDYAKRIQSAAVRLDSLVNDLLSYARVSRLDLPLSRVGLRALVLSICENALPEIERKHAAVKYDLVSGHVWANPTILETALSNLLWNALKFSKPGVAPDITVSTENNTGVVRISVRDNGIGIDPDHQQAVFGLFNRLHEQDAYPGTGVGLAIVKKGIERIGGKVGLESTRDLGSCFWIELPAAP